MIENIQNEDVKNELEKKFNDIKNYLCSVFQLSNDIEFGFDIEVNKGKLEIIVGISNPNHNLEYKIQDITPNSIKIDYLLKVIFKNISFDCSKHLIKRYIALFSNAFIEIDKSVLENDNYSDFINIFTSLSFEKCNFYIQDRTTLDGFNFFNDLTFIDCYFSNKLLIGECIFEKKFIFETRKNQKHELFVMNTRFKDNCEIILNTDEDTLELSKVQFDKEFDCIKCNLHNIKSIFFNEVVFEDYFYVADRLDFGIKTILLPIDFKASIIFKDVIFKKETDFSQTEFKQDITLDTLTFHEKVAFGSCVTLKSDMDEILKLDNITFLSDVDFSKVSFVNIILHIEKTVFEKSFSLTIADDYKSNINKFSKGLVIQNSTFKDDVNLSNCCFNCEVRISNCTFKGYVKIHRSYFQDKVQFKKNIVNKVIDFDISEFKEEVIFDYTIFNDTLSLLFVMFQKAPKIALAKFTNSANIQTFNLRIGASNEELNEDCYREENIENTMKELEARTDTYRLMKDQAIKNNDLLVATENKKSELYARELELDYCKKIYGIKYPSIMYQKTTWEIRNFKIVEMVDRVFLKLNRAISDHHTDFLKILLFTLSVIGVYFIINIILSFSLFGLKDNSLSNIVLLSVLALNTLFLMCLLFKRAKRDLKSILSEQMSFKIQNLFKYFGRYSCNLKYGKYLLILLVLFLFLIIYFVDSMMVLSIILPLAFALALFVIITLFYEDSKATILDDIDNIAIFKIKHTALSFAIFGIIGIVISPSIITPFLGAFSEDARNHYLYKAIDELDDKKALELARIILPNDKDLKKFESSKTILSKNAKLEQISIFDKTDLSVNFIYEQSNQDKNEQSIYKAKKILKDYKDELKSSKLLDESPELKRAVAIDGGVSRLNIAYYLVLAFCIFALQKTMRKNSIIPS